LLNFVLEI